MARDWIDPSLVAGYGMCMGCTNHGQASLFIDADSCPRQLRTIILKAVLNRKLSAIFVADRPLPDVVEVQEQQLLDAEGIPLVCMVVVEAGDNSADDYLVKIGREGTIAITRDIPLADRLATLGMVVLDDRGGVYTKDTIGERLSMRNLMTDLREFGIHIEKTKPLGPREVQSFANALDREITRLFT